MSVLAQRNGDPCFILLFWQTMVYDHRAFGYTHLSLHDPGEKTDTINTESRMFDQVIGMNQVCHA